MSEGDIGGVSRFIMSPFDDTENLFRRVETRVMNIEARVTLLETERAVNEEKRKFMGGRFNQIDTRLDRIDGHISRLVWLIIATILGSLLTFLMRSAVLPI